MSIEQDIAFMERVPSLGLLGRPALRVLAIGAETRHVATGRVLYVAGESADAAYLIQDGAFSLRPDGPSEAEDVKVTSGTLLGEAALMTETTWSATATAMESSLVLRIPRSLFLKMLDGYPESARRLREDLVARASEWGRDLASARSILTRAREAEKKP